MNRISSLPFSEFCGLAPRLGSEYGAGRAAAMGSAFHAQCSGIDAERWLALLTPDERSEIAEWYPVAPWAIDGLTLTYEDAERELAVALKSDGTACDEHDPEAMCVGHLDCAWTRSDTAYVCDIKRSAFTVSEGADSLQLVAYGFAYAALRSCRYFIPAIWAATEGELIVGTRIDTHDFGSAAIWARVAHAATNRGEPSRGAHCLGCYSRLHCPEHLLPAALAAVNPAVAQLTYGGPPADAAGALQALLLAKGLEDLAKVLQEHGRAFAAQRGLVDPACGKKLLQISLKGRESGPSVAELRKRLGPKAEDLIKRGQSYSQWKWVKV